MLSTVINTLFGLILLYPWQQAKKKYIYTYMLSRLHTYTIIPAAAAAAKSLQLCPTLCDPIDGSPPGSTVPGILQARTLEWVAISFSSAWKWKVKVKSLSRVRLFETPWTAAYQAPPSMGFSRQQYWSGVPSPSPIIPAAAKSFQSCPTLCDPRDGSPRGPPVPGILQARTLEWVAISFSNAWKWKVKVKLLSPVRLLATQWTVAHQAPPSMGFSRQECWSGVPLPSPNWLSLQLVNN